MKGQDLRDRLGQESITNELTMNHNSAPPRPDHSLYRDVYQRLRSEILAGRLAAGARLPSSRTLASQLGVARGTIEVAYQMLAGEGYTITAGARGTMVNPALSLRRRTRPAAKPESRAQRLRFPPGPLLFQMGLPALDVFPRKQWSQIAARVVRSVDVEQLAHPHDILGYEPLRQAIASYLRIARDIACTGDQIMITAGFQGALGFIIQALLAPRDEVWVDDPGYFFAHELLRGAHLRLAPIPIDDEGLDVAAGTRLAPDAALAVVTPTHQFPLGMTLPVDRRLALLDWADRKHAFIVEDDYDCEFHHRGLPPPALKSLDRSGRVLYVGSFSKVLFPGLRLGYLVVPDAVIDRFIRLGRATHPAPALMVQKLVEAFMSQGHFSRHLSRMRSLYTERRKALATALEAAMPRQLDIKLQDGGMHFVAHLRGRTDDMELVERLRRKGIGPGPLSLHAIRRNAPNGLMIGYPNVPSDEAHAAAQRMLAAMR
jgi:GntR family transcriptional regulator/MocR family aminotransferase